MQKITEKGLRKNLGEEVRIEREGIIGNSLNRDGTVKEGRLFGILEKDTTGFYIKMFKTDFDDNPYAKSWQRVDRNNFLKTHYRIQDRDVMNIETKKGVKSYLVRIN